MQSRSTTVHRTKAVDVPLVRRDDIVTSAVCFCITSTGTGTGGTGIPPPIYTALWASPRRSQRESQSPESPLLTRC